jgi:DNA polymerase I-like protein with 3'-5' exonuclease and polymerase domains
MTAWLLKVNKENIIRLGRIILVPDNVTDTSLFCLPVQTYGADAFKPAPCRIYSGLEGVDARIVHTFLHDEIVIEATDGREDRVQTVVKESMEAAFEKIIPKVPFVVKIRVADSWEG